MTNVHNQPAANELVGRFRVGREPDPTTEKAASDDLKLSIYSSFDQARHLQQSWDKFVQEVSGDIFSTYHWCAIWWRHFGHGRRLELYVAMVGDEIVGVFPLFRETIQWGPLFLRVVRIVGCDHCGTMCSVAIHPHWIYQVTCAVVKALDSRSKWDLIHIGELPGYFRHAQALGDALRRCKQTGQVSFHDDYYPHMVFDVPDTFEEYLVSLSRKERRNVCRDERRLEQKGRIEVYEPRDRDELHRAFSELVELHRCLWNRRGWLGHFGDFPNIEAFHREIAETLLRRGRLVLVEVRAGGKLVASEYGLRFGQRIHWIIGGRRRDTTSRAGFCALVRAAIQRGVNEIDAISGYDYKKRLGAHTLSFKTITVFSPRMMSRVRAQLFRAATWLVYLVHFRIWYWHLAPWLRTRLPNFRFPLLNASLWQRFIRARFLVTPKRRCSVSLTSKKSASRPDKAE